MALFSWSPKRHCKAAVLSHSRQTDIDTKKPAGLAPCGLLGLHRMTLVITDGEFWGLASLWFYLQLFDIIVFFIGYFIFGFQIGTQKRATTLRMTLTCLVTLCSMLNVSVMGLWRHTKIGRGIGVFPTNTHLKLNEYFMLNLINRQYFVDLLRSF